MALQDKYINPFTDFGFKKLFGSEPNKDLLIDFLNQVLPVRHKIKELTYARTEQLGNTETDRKAIFDLYCIGENGERFIVEMQKAKQNFFKDRSVYYSSFPIQEQAKKGEGLEHEDGPAARVGRAIDEPVGEARGDEPREAARGAEMRPNPQDEEGKEDEDAPEPLRLCKDEAVHG